jgi:hypothetical protein
MYDPVAEAELTGHQMRHIIRAFYLRWNTTPKPCLGDRSPLDLVRESLLAGRRHPVLDPHDVERALAKTVPNRVLTTNGVVYDGIRYRGDGIEQFLNDNFRDTPHAERTKGSAKCIVSIRTYEWDIDYIDVYDAHNRSYLRLYSTQPGYTSGLSRWGHDQFKKMARARRELFNTERQKILSRLKSLRSIDVDAPSVPVRRRARMFALYEAEQVRRLSGKRAERPDFQHPLPEQFFPITSAATLRRDVPAPPPGPKQAEGRGAKAYPAPPRPDGYFTIGGQTAPAARGAAFDWSAVGDAPVDDETNDDADDIADDERE